MRVFPRPPVDADEREAPPVVRVRRRLMEVPEVDGFDFLFITERPEAEGRGPEKPDPLKRRKGSTEANQDAPFSSSDAVPSSTLLH